MSSKTILLSNIIYLAFLENQGAKGILQNLYYSLIILSSRYITNFVSYLGGKSKKEQGNFQSAEGGEEV
jgi:hypothetical protein